MTPTSVNGTTVGSSTTGTTLAPASTTGTTLVSSANGTTVASSTTGTTAVSSTTVTGINTTALVVGERVTGTGIAAGTTIVAIPTPGTSGKITLSTAATAAGTGVSLSFGSTSVTGINTTGLVVGEYVTGTGITAGTTITAIPTPGTSGTVTLSAPATAAGTGSLSFASTSITGINTTGLVVGESVVGTGIAAGTTIAAIPTPGTSGTITLSTPTTGSVASLYFGTANTVTQGSTTNTNKSVTGVNTTGLVVGESVTGTGIAAGTTIAAIPTPGTSGTITLSAAATATGSSVPLSFGTGNKTANSTTVSGINTIGLYVGQAVYGAGIAPGTTISAITVTGNSGAITLSQASTVTGAGVAFVTENSYSGTTTVNQGDFQVGVNGFGTTGTGALTVNSGATLSGSGLINGTTVFNAGASLTPGDNFGTSIGTLTFNGNVTLNDASNVTLKVAAPTLTDAGINASLALGKYDTTGGYRSTHLTTWDSSVIPVGASDLLTVNGTMTLNHAQITIQDSGFVTNAASGQVFNVVNWISLAGSSTFNAGTNYRTGGSGGGNLILPTLSGGLVYDVSQFTTSGIFTIITPPTAIPVLMSSYNIVGGGSWASAVNWSPNLPPQSVNSIANFTSNISSNAVVTLDGNETVGMIFIGDQNNTNFFTIAQGSSGSLIFDNGVYGAAYLSKVQSTSTTVGVDIISAPVQLNSDLNINVGSGGDTARLDISGAISQTTAGTNVNIMGAGRVTISGLTANSYTGLTTVFSRGAADATNPDLVLAKAMTFASTQTGTLAISTTAGSNIATLTGNGVSTAGLYIGMPVTGNAGIPSSNTVITSIIDSTHVQLSNAATATATGVATTFAPLALTTSAGSASVTLTAGSTAFLEPGMKISGNANIPNGATISSITGPTTFTLSTAAATSGASVATNVGLLSTTTIGAQVSTATTAAGSATVTLTSGNTTNFYVGMSLAGSGNANIPAGATVASIISSTQFTLNSGTGVTAGTGVSTTFNGVKNVVTASSTAGFYAGMPVVGNPNIPTGAVITAVLNSTQFVVSNAASSAATNVVTGFGTDVVNGAIQGNLKIGNASMGGDANATLTNNTSVVQLAGNNQIADTATIIFDSGIGGYSASNGSNNAYFKMMGFNETVAAISNYDSSGVIENTDGESGYVVNSTLTLNTSGLSYFNGYLRDRGNNSSSGIMNLVVSGTGTQVLAGGNITYSGLTTINTGATLVLDTTTNFGIGTSGGTRGVNTINDNGTLVLRNTGSGTFTFGSATANGSGTTLTATSGSLVRDSGPGSFDPATRNPIVTIVNNITLGAGISVLEGGTTNFFGRTNTTNGGFYIKGKENLTTVNLTANTNIQGTNAQGSGLTVFGTGNNIIDGALLTITAQVNVTNSVSVLAGDVRLSGLGTLNTPSILISGEGSTVSSTTITGFGILNDTTASGGAANNITNRLNKANISLDAGRLMLTGNGTGSEVFSETTGSLTIAGGANYISSVKTNASSSTLTFKDLSGGRTSYSTVVFDSLNGSTTDTGGIIAFTNAPNLDSSGIMGGWAYRTTSSNGVVLYEFATISGNQVVPYSGYAVNNFSGGSNSNVKMTASQTIGSSSISSLNIQSTSALTLTINPGSTLDIRTGGILSSLGNQVITGGYIQSDSGTNYELITHLPTNQLTINSSIINNGSNAVALVKSGAATLYLTPQTVRTTTYTIGNTTATVTGTGATNGMAVGNTVTGTGIVAGTTITAISGSTITLSAAPTVSGTNASLTFGLFNTYTGKTVINEGSLAINNETDLGANPTVFTPDQLYINGGTLQVNSDLVLNDTNRGITMGTADGTISVASNKTLSISATNPITATLGRLIFSASSTNLGEVVISGNNNLSGGVETTGNQTATTGQLGSTYIAGNTTVTVSTTAGLEVGMAVTGNGIPAGTTVSSINADGIHYVLSQTPTSNGSNTLLTYDGFDALKLTGNNTIGLIRLLGSTLSLQGTNTLTSDIVVGAGLLRLGGDNTFSGVMTIRAGTIRFESSTGIDNAAGYNLVATGGLIDLNGFNTTVSQLTGAANITNNASGASVLTINASSSFAYAGSIISGTAGGQLSLVKNGSGVLTLSSGLSTYTGPTIINGGVINAATLDFGGNSTSIGAASNAAANLVLNQGTLRYNGASDAFTDRSFTLGTGDNAGGLVADGARIDETLTMGYVGLSPAIAFTGAGSRTLTLGGANRGDNLFNLVLGDSGTLNADGSPGRTSLVKNGIGTWVIGATNTYSGETVVNAGILAATVDGAFGVKGGGGIIIGGGSNASTVLGLQNATLDLRNVTYNTVNQIYLAGGTLATTTGTSTWAGDVYVTGNSNISVADGAMLTIKGTIGGPGGITQLGNGTVDLSGQADPTTRNVTTSASPNYTVQAGTLILDYSTNNTSKLADTGTLTLGGSRLGGAIELLGGSHVEVVAGVTLAAGFNEVFQNASNPGTAVLHMNAITRQAGAAINFGANNIASTTSGLTNGILGGWATVGGTSWATTAQEIVSSATSNGSTGITMSAAAALTVSVGQVVSGTGIQSGTTVVSISGTNVTLSKSATATATSNLNFGNLDSVGNSNLLITALNYYTNSGAFTPGPTTNDWVTNTNIDIVGNSTQTNETVNTLRFNNTSPDASHTPAAAYTTYNVTLSGTNTIQTGGILFTNNMGAHSAIIGSDGTGKLVNGAGAGADLLILQSNTGSGVLDISAVIANGSGGTNGVDKSGVGSLLLNGQNTYTGVNTINEGMVSVNNLSVVGYAANSVLTAVNQSAGNLVTVNATGGTAGLTYGEIVTGTGLPAVTTIAATTTSSSNSITVPVASTVNLSVGLPVFGAGIAAGTTIASINSTTGAVTLSANATASGSGVNLNFGGSYIKAINSLTQFTMSNGSVANVNNSPFTFISSASSPVAPGASSVTAASSTVSLLGGATTAGLTPGQSVSSSDGTTIPANDTILSIVDATHFTLNQPANTANGSINLIYGSASLVAGSLNATTQSGSLVTVPSTIGLTVGETVSGNGIPAGSYITSITGINSILLNNAVTSTGQNNLTFGASGSTLSASYNGTTAVTVSSTAGLSVGEQLIGSGIPAGATIASIVDATHLLMSVSATISNNLFFGGSSILATTTNGNTTLSVVSTAGLTVGEALSGPGIAAGATITNIVNSTQFQISIAPTISASNSLAFGSSTTTLLASTTSGSTSVVVSSTVGLNVGEQISGNGIPAGTTITSILDATHIQISVAATATDPNTLVFSAPLSNTLLAASTSSGSKTVTVPSTVGLSVGQAVTGVGIPAGTTVASILDSTHVGLSQAAQSTASVSLSFGGAANALGASLNGAANLVFNGGELQYNGLSTFTDRGFTINAGVGAQFDVGNAYTTLTLGGNITTPAAQDNYSIVKTGAGVLDFFGYITPNSGSYGLTNLTVNDGTLRLESYYTDQFVRNDVGSLTLGGGNLTVVGSAGRATIQDMPGSLVVNAGASVITVTASGNVDTTLNLQDVNNPQSAIWNPGSTLLFVKNDPLNGSGSANITLSGVFGVDAQVILPRATWTITDDQAQHPGVNYFAFVDVSLKSNGTSYNVLGSDFNGVAAHTIQGNPATWTSSMNVTDGALSPDAYSGTTVTGATVNTIRFYNSSYVTPASGTYTVPGTSTVTIGSTLTINQGAILQTTHAGDHINSITGGTLTSGLINTDYNSGLNSTTTSGSSTVTVLSTANISVGEQVTGTGIPAGATVAGITDATHYTLSANANATGTNSLVYLGTSDLIVHNWDPLTALSISSVIANNTTTNSVVNLVQTGNGTTALSGANTYTGTTYVEGGVLRLDNAAALPALSYLVLDNGVLGLNSGDFTRSLGTGASQVSWNSSGGFAAYTANRNVNLGGSGALVTWGAGGFVLDNDSLLLGADDANKTVTFINSIDLGLKSRMVNVTRGDAGVTSDAILSGTLQGAAGSLIKAGYGTLELSATTNTYGGGTVVAEGTLIGDNDSSFGTGAVSVGTTSDTPYAQEALTLNFQGDTFSNALTFGNTNSTGISVFQGTAALTSVTSTVTLQRPASSNVFINTAPTTNVTFSGQITGSGGFTLNGGGTMTLANSTNNYGTLSGASGSGQAATIVRNGTLILTSNTSLSGSTLQLGDATYQLGAATYQSTGNVDYATAGASLLGVENSYSFIADNRNALGGVFLATGNGTVDGTGAALSGPGAFYNVSAVVGGTNIVTDAFTHSVTEASSFGVNTTIITLGGTATTTNLFVGTQISGPGIAPGTVISQILSSTQFSISQATTADGSASVSLTYTGLSTRILVKDEVNNPERNGVYQLAQVNADGTMNLVRAPDFSTTANMLYGTQVTVGTTTYFMAAHSVGTVNGTGTDPVYWLQDSSSPSATLTVQPAVTAVTQNIDLYANTYSGTSYYGYATINASSPVTFSGNVTLQNLLPGVQETHTLYLNSTATTGTGMLFSGVISEVQGGFAATADQLQVTLNGSGVTTLSGANTYYGGTNVYAGTLLVNNTSGSGTGHGDIYVGTGALLAGTGTIAVDAGHNIAIDTGATLATGNPGTSTSGTALNINLGTGSILAIAGNLSLNLFSNSGGINPSSAVDSLVITGSGGKVDLTGLAVDANSNPLTPGYTGGIAATLTVHNVNSLPTTAFNVGDSFKLINWGSVVPTGTFANLTVVSMGSFYSQDFTDLPALPGNEYWNLANLYTLGTITVAIPEPSRVWLLLLGLLGMGLRRRRRSLW